MKPMRHLDRDTRRARLLAARRRPICSINRRGILSGQWDLGAFVRQFREGAGAFRKAEGEPSEHLEIRDWAASE